MQPEEGEEEEDDEEYMMYDGHCWHIAVAENEKMIHGGPAIAGKAEEDTGERLELVEEGEVVLMCVSEAR